MKNKKIISIGTLITVMALSLSLGLTAFASSHREAPLTAGDPKVDATDLYAFVSPDNQNTVTLIANYIPFQEPAGGPNFYQFDDNAMYAINVDNNGDAVADIVYQFRFKTLVGNGNTFLYNTGTVNNLNDASLNIRQVYTLTKVEGSKSTVLATDVPVGPSNVGPKSMPNYAGLQSQAVLNVGNTGIKTFAGQSDDSFFAELGGLFDLLTIRKLPGNMGGGVDGLKGYNVNSIALQIPIEQLTNSKNRPTSATSSDAVIGTWTTSYRQATKVISANPTSNTTSGDWIQVSRLGAPLVNEVVVPIAAKDLWNGSNPKDDAQFANGVTNPELGTLLKALYGIKVPPQGKFGTPEARDDLVAIFLTGIPGLTKPTNVVPSEQLRLNLAIPVTANPNKLGVLAGDNQGFPNGRRLADDVTDIEIRAVAGAAYPLFHPNFVPDATGVQLGDGVDANDVAFRTSFPYLALPHQGYASVPHGANTITSGNGSDKCMINGNLKVGSRGSMVSCLQMYLKSQGYLSATAPLGFFGAHTRAAVIKWQNDADIEADGNFGSMSSKKFNMR
ncbi:DUF4331 family protein [Arenimonas sp.]|nr:DUF4331 family protein [Candidatus Parcubacteria bacterium]